MNPILTVRSAATLATVAAALTAVAAAQGPDMLVTYSQPEQTLSGSGGTVLRFLRPNEVCHLEWSNGPCASPSAEKWAPRTAYHVMAGDENGNARYWNPAIFGEIDALCVPIATTPIAGGVNARTCFFSPSAAMGTNVSGPPGLRPGDVGRIVRNGAGFDGQVEHFMRQEQFNQAMGLPLNAPIDVDAICFQPGLGVYFSLDQDVPGTTFCGPALLRDGDVLAVPDWAITWTPDFRVAAVLPNSIVVIYSEAQVDAMVVAAQVTDRFGNCLTQAIDLEALEFDWNGTVAPMFPCPGTVAQRPPFVFSVETGTGASLLTTVGGGAIYSHLCGAAGRGCGGGPTFGMQMGVLPTNATTGAPSWINALAATSTTRFVLEPHQHVQNVPGGAPLGATGIDFASPYAWNFALIELVPPTVPGSISAFPFSLLCFPDLYAQSLNVWWWPLNGPWGTFPMVAIPPAWSGKVLYQAVGFGGSGFELSTPTVIDVN
jgi:hypothetical protein